MPHSSFPSPPSPSADRIQTHANNNLYQTFDAHGTTDEAEPIDSGSNFSTHTRVGSQQCLLGNMNKEANGMIISDSGGGGGDKDSDYSFVIAADDDDDKNIKNDGGGDDIMDSTSAPSAEPSTTVVTRGQRIRSSLQRVFTLQFANVLVLGLSFMVVFAAFSTTQGLMTLNHGVWGSISLGVVYGVFAFSSFVTPFVEKVVGAKIGLLIGVVPYTIFVLVSGFTLKWLLVSSAVLLGFGAAMLWTAHGSFLAKCAGDEMGFYSGVFFALFQFNGIIGSAITGVMKTFHLAQWIIFTVLFCIALVGGFLMLFLRSMDPKKQKKEKRVKKMDPETGDVAYQDRESRRSTTGASVAKTLRELCWQLIQSVKATVQVMLETRKVLLMPMYLYSGYSISFFMGRLPPVIGDDWAVWTLAVFALAECVGSVIFGKLTDKLGKRIMTLATFAAHAIAVFITFYVEAFAPYSYFVAMLLCGLADSGLNTSIYSIISGFYSVETDGQKPRSAEAFSAFKFVQSISSAAGFASGLLLSYFWTQIVLISMFALAVFAFLILDFFVSPVDRKRPTKRGAV